MWLVCGLLLQLFIFSKFPELLDTAFLVLQKKKVIFLHWFHHCTVLLYCWHAFHHRIAPGLWFAAMNFSVHSVMYTYYFLSCSVVGLRWLVRPFAPFVTFIQIAQMFIGIAVTVTAALRHSEDPQSCATDAANWKLGLGMYTSYFLLFIVLFLNLYCTKGRGHRAKEDKQKQLVRTRTHCLQARFNPWWRSIFSVRCLDKVCLSPPRMCLCVCRRNDHATSWNFEVAAMSGTLLGFSVENLKRSSARRCVHDCMPSCDRTRVSLFNRAPNLNASVPSFSNKQKC